MLSSDFKIGPRFILGSFLALILIGTVLLNLPAASRDPGRMPLVDALFTATSAVCVTGLIVVDTGSYFTPFGQAVILILIQLGGLGLMTMATFFLVMIGRRISLRGQLILQDSLGEAHVKSLSNQVKSIVILTIVFEAAGAFIFAARLHHAYDYPWKRAAVSGVFHAISAFCNAGFSLYSDSLMRFGHDWWITLTMGGLLVAGGLGFVVWFNIAQFHFWRRDRVLKGRLRLHVKLALTVSLALFLVMLFSLLAGEWNNTLSGYSWSEKFSRAVFQALTPRTAGFNTLPVERLAPTTIWMTILMMFIGASPGGTGGGIKTTTFAVILTSVFSLLRGRRRSMVFQRVIPEGIVIKAIAIMLIAIGVVFFSTTLLFWSETRLTSAPNNRTTMGDSIFEVVSAFGTVGLSTGITPSLSRIGRLVITATMYIGRVGPLTIALLLGRKKLAPATRHPEESVLVG